MTYPPTKFYVIFSSILEHNFIPSYKSYSNCNYFHVTSQAKYIYRLTTPYCFSSKFFQKPTLWGENCRRRKTSISITPPLAPPINDVFYERPLIRINKENLRQLVLKLPEICLGNPMHLKIAKCFHQITNLYIVGLL